jgi:hypothetical protein
VLDLIKGIITLGILGSIGFCVFVNVANAPQKSAHDDANRQGAEQLITTLVAYHTAHGAFPAELDAIVPAHLAVLPQVQPSQSGFHYTALEDGKDYLLSYPEAAIGTLPSDAEFEYRASAGVWEHRVY